MVVPEDKVEAAKAAGENVVYDEEKKEHFKMVGYRRGADNEAPNSIYKQVYADNKKLTFESDIYSDEFFDSISNILNKVTSFKYGSNEAENAAVLSMRLKGVGLGRKVLYDVLSRCKMNFKMGSIIRTMIKIFEQDDELCKQFVLNELEN